MLYCFFFFNAPATTEIYTLSLHDALPISAAILYGEDSGASEVLREIRKRGGTVSGFESVLRSKDGSNIPVLDRKSTRLNSSHPSISYAVFCLKKKKIQSFTPLSTTSVHTT